VLGQVVPDLDRNRLGEDDGPCGDRVRGQIIDLFGDPRGGAEPLHQLRELDRIIVLHAKAAVRRRSPD
jgi:hypothetical protein